MANYTMQCRKCGVHTDYSSKTSLCDACEADGEARRKYDPLGYWHNRAEQSEQRIRELEQELSKTIHERDLALRSANTYRQRMRGWQDGAAQSADTFVCRIEELEQQLAQAEKLAWECPACYERFDVTPGDEEKNIFCPLCKGPVRPIVQLVKQKITQAMWEELKQENSKLRNELAEIEAATVPSGQYLDVVARYDKLRAELERRRPLEEE